MIDLWGNETKPFKKQINKAKRNFENRFQRWSDKQAQDETTSNGKCGYGFICDYCDGKHNGRECIRALNSALKDKKLIINYENVNCEDVWDGKF